MQNVHNLVYNGKTLTVSGVAKVVELTEKEAIFKLEGCTLTVKGSGLNVTKLDKNQGEVVLDLEQLSSVTYGRTAGIKGLFK